MQKNVITVAPVETTKERYPRDAFDLVLTSPPYENVRAYNNDFNLRGEHYVEWMVDVCLQLVEVCSGLVVVVIEGVTRQFQYSATPLLLAADLHRRGVVLRKPPLYVRHGRPGSGGPDWLKNRYEFCLCMQRERGRLPWSDNVAMGHKQKYGRGGSCVSINRDGTRTQTQDVDRSKLANPGNLIECKSGGGHMGDRVAHKHPAPFPERLAEFFIKSFCAPGGIVYDPFCGSGTTPAVASRLGRRYVASDVSQEFVEMARGRVCNS